MNKLFTLSLCAAACAGDLVEVGERSAPLTPVTWTDRVGVSASGNDLTKTAPETTFNAGAVSVESLGDDGYVEFTTGEATTDKACGLANGNGDQSLGDIDYAIRLNGSGRVSIVEGGTTRASAGTYAPGDVFRVQTLGEVVTYYRNGELLYTSELAPSFPLVVDTSLRTPGATIQEVALESLAFWTDVVNADAVGSDLTKTAPDARWNAGAASIAAIPSGDGYVELGVADSVTRKAAGLSRGNNGNGRADIDFAFDLGSTAGASIYEGGTRVGYFGGYKSTDLFQIEVSGGVVSYFRNRRLLYTSQVAPSFPLLLDASLYSPGAAIRDARIVAGRPLEDCAPFQQSILGDEAGDTFGGGFLAASDLLAGYTYGEDTTKIYRQGPTGWALEEELPFQAEMSDDGSYLRDFVADGIQLYRRGDGVWIDDGVITQCPGNPGSWDVAGDLAVEHGIDGLAYVWRRGAGGWNLEARFAPALGGRVVVAGDRFFLADDGDDAAGTDAGAIAVYHYDAALPDSAAPTCGSRSRGKWTLEGVLRPSNAAAWQRFPYAFDVSADGTRVLAGNRNASTAHVFDLVAGAWTETSLLTPDPVKEDFGYTVALGGPDESVAVVGQRRYGATSTRAYVFTARGGIWRQIALLTGPEDYATHVAATADTIFVGDRLDDTAGTNAGAIRIHGIEPLCIAQ